MSSQALEEEPSNAVNEAFKTRLVNDVFGKDNHGKVQMEKIVMLIWIFRDDPSVVKFMAHFVAKFAGSRDVFAGIEFYLPQVAHMLIHLDVDWDEAILEQFALVVAQQSLHFALQLNWILQGAIEDYEPELPNGTPNPGYNAPSYNRCILLLRNIERTVVYGRPRSQELQRLLDTGKITKSELDILELHDRRYNANQIQEMSTEDGAEAEPTFGGELLYKRKVRTSCYKPKPWKTRYFCIQNTMLHCFNTKGGKLVRSMPLENALVGDVEKGKYRHMFFVENRAFHFIIRANSSKEKNRWMNALREEAKALDLFQQTEEFLQGLSPAQRARFEFFRNERDFCRDVCGIAEDLRFHDRDTRKAMAPTLVKDLPIASRVYVPLCNSTGIWRRVDQSIPTEVKVFNTKERCPILMNFVSRRGEFNHSKDHPELNDVNLGVAEYLHLTFDVADQKNLGVSGHGDDIMQVIQEEQQQNDDDSMEISSSTHASLWHDEGNIQAWNNQDTDNSNIRHTEDNQRVQKFLNQNLRKMPKKLANRIVNRRMTKVNSEVLGRSTAMLESVPIIGEERRNIDDDEDSVVSVEHSSAVSNRHSLLPKSGTKIDGTSFAKATKIICDIDWAQRTADMLRPYSEGEGVVEVSSMIVKSNDDLRQEVFVMQMIHYYKSVFAKAKLDVWLKTYRILSISKDTGMIETLQDATSINDLKKSSDYPAVGGLRAYFEQVYGTGASFKEAQRNFMKSLAGYSLVSYLLGLKDRHNGNIMITNLGQLIFIDFGFAMGMAPGHEFSFERANFKLTKEYVDLLDGWNSPLFQEFRALFVEGIKEARKNSLIALGLVEIMMYKSNYPCFSGWRYGNGIALKKFKQRLLLSVPDAQVAAKAQRLIDQAYNHDGTNLYDKFQKWSNGIAI
mmetsp:Transcript_14836/g.16466  ORF Transcript_14836/g.16466 Transcript_14836/m.16466 type:complete len:903 (-) Transcript_14836:95-2803(-)